MTDEIRDLPAEDQPVIDIHTPHEAAHSWRDIFIHLATITVGLFIALSLEGCVEWQHHRHLVKEARANIRSEIQDNQRDLQSALKEIDRETQEAKTDVTILREKEQHPETGRFSASLRFSGTQLSRASWDTARETGALGFMSYSEVKSYAGLYGLQELFANQTMRMIGAYTAAMPSFDEFDVDKPKEQKAKEFSDALQRIYVVQSEVAVEKSAAEALSEQYTEVLKQRF